MVWTKRFVAAAALATVVGAAAHAADWPGQYPPPLPPPKVVEYSPWGWYLRGDLGYRIGLLTAPQSAPGFSDPTDNKLGDGIVAGVGVGIRSQWLRTDLTIDYGTPQKYTGTVLTS